MDIIQTINKNKNLFTHLIYKIKVCLICDFDEENWNKLTFAEKMFNELDKNIEDYLSSKSQADYNVLNNNYFTVEEVLTELKDDIVSKYKLASVVMLDNMKLDEIKVFYEKIKKVMSKYINISNASSDIFYYSGKELSYFVSTILKYINTHEIPNKKFIPIAYLLQFENVITVEYKDWIMLFKSIRSTMKYLNDLNDEEMIIIKDKYMLFNVYYFIVISGGDR